MDPKQTPEQEQATVEKGIARLDSLGPTGALDVAIELSSALNRHGWPCGIRFVAHLAGRCTDAEWAAMVVRYRARKALEPN